jgi:microcystin-dependent protein
MLTLPNLGLTQWPSPSDHFSYVELANNWKAIDDHDHTTGKGVQIPTGGLANLAVTLGKLASDSVDASKIVNGSVGSAELASGAVGTTQLADGSITVAKLASTILATLAPPGVVFPYGGSAAPSGFLLANGATVNRTTYAGLFAVYGTTYNTGGEAGTDFRLPDLRGRVIVAAGSGSGLTPRSVGATGGEETHVLTTGEVPSITVRNDATDFGSANVAASDATGTTTTIGGGGAHNNMQPWFALNYIIKT